MKKFLKIGIVLVFIVMFVFTNIYAFSINDLNGEGSTTDYNHTFGNWFFNFSYSINCIRN